MGSVVRDDASSKLNLSSDILLVHVPLPPDQEWIAKLESTYPGFQVRWYQRAPILAQDKGIPDELWEGVTMVMGTSAYPAHLMSKVRYVQLSSAGADRWVNHEVYKNKDVIFCTANGCHP